MEEARLPRNEDARLAALRRRVILDTEREGVFDELVELASVICGTPMAALTLVDRDRQWFKAAKGLRMTQTPRSISFCGHTILKKGMTIVADSRKDQRFHDNPLVTGAPFIRSYAGTPLCTNGGHRIGSLCVIDTKPMALTASQRDALSMLGAMAMRLIDARATAIQREASDRRFLVTVDALPTLVWLAAPDGRFLFLNQRWLEFTGRDYEQECGLGWLEHVHPDDVGEWQAAMDAACRDRCGFRLEQRLLHADGTYHWIEVVARPHADAGGAFLGFVGACTDLTEQKRLQHALLHATELEQNKLAAELHDGLGQDLTGMSLLAAAATTAVDQDPKFLRDVLGQLHVASNQAISACRAISRGLSPLSDLHGGLLSALKELVRLQRDTYGTAVELVTTITGFIHLSTERQGHLFRITQEAITNARKHAGLASIVITLAVDPEHVVLCVTDDGRGLPAPRPAAGGLGLRLMKFRAALIGARLAVTAIAPHGTEVRCECPQFARGMAAPVSAPAARPRARARAGARRQS